MTKFQHDNHHSSILSLSDSFRTDYTSPYTTISRYRRQHEQLQRLQRQRELDERRRARLQRLAAANQGHPFFNRLPVSYFNSATGKAAESNEAADKQFPFFFGFGTMVDRDLDTFDMLYLLLQVLTTTALFNANYHI